MLSKILMVNISHIYLPIQCFLPSAWWNRLQPTHVAEKEYEECFLNAGSDVFPPLKRL